MAQYVVFSLDFSGKLHFSIEYLAVNLDAKWKFASRSRPRKWRLRNTYIFADRQNIEGRKSANRFKIMLFQSTLDFFNLLTWYTCGMILVDPLGPRWGLSGIAARSLVLVLDVLHGRHCRGLQVAPVLLLCVANTNNKQMFSLTLIFIVQYKI